MMRAIGRVLPAVFVVAAFAISAVAYPHLPAQIPTHWGISGHPDEYSGRLAGTYGLPILMLGLGVLLSLAPKYDRALFVRYEGRASDVNTARPIYALMVTLILALMLTMHVFGLAQAFGWIGQREGTILLTVLLSLFAIVLGNYMPRNTRRNAFVGFRMPWAYASEEVWRRTQRAAGYGMVLSGVVGLTAAMLVPAVSFKVLISVMLAQLTVVAIYSYVLARSREVP